MCISHLLSINFWFIIPLQTTSFWLQNLPQAIFASVFSMKTWKKKKQLKCQKNVDLEISHLYFKWLFAVDVLSQQPRFLLSGKREISLVPSCYKAEKRKRETSNENSLFHYSNMWITLSCSQAMGLTHNVLQHLFKPFSTAILHFH